ncbi:MAG TPA: hypothetical protein VHB70_18540 [Parafilimonas sp.]|nr:hypothetical protein [Parafilimonas sp.]
MQQWCFAMYLNRAYSTHNITYPDTRCFVEAILVPSLFGEEILKILQTENIKPPFACTAEISSEPSLYTFAQL